MQGLPRGEWQMRGAHEGSPSVGPPTTIAYAIKRNARADARLREPTRSRGAESRRVATRACVLTRSYPGGLTPRGDGRIRKIATRTNEWCVLFKNNKCSFVFLNNAVSAIIRRLLSLCVRVVVGDSAI